MSADYNEKQKWRSVLCQEETDMCGFLLAVPVWGENLSGESNQFLGFHAVVEGGKDSEITIAVAARSYYRLYIDGEIRAYGPARTAKHYCRVDRHTFRVSGMVHIAIEGAAYDKPEKYCNDCTLEPGMLAAEIMDSEGNILAATGKKGFLYTELKYRKSNVETMSHSRGIIEWYKLKEDSFQWVYGDSSLKWSEPVSLQEKIGWLPRRAPYASLRPIPMRHMGGISDMEDGGEAEPGFVLTIAREFNRKWYECLKEEDQFLQKLRGLKEVPFTGTYRLSMRENGDDGQRNKKEKILYVTPGERPASVIFENEETELGFIDFEIIVEKNTVVDVINTDHLSVYGELRANSYVTRYELAPGSYHLTTFEPKLVRYIRMIFSTEGKVTLTFPRLLDNSYPDEGNTYFSSSDGELNRIYDGARRTLRLSTLDIFMDCPQRERGGWLCDSHFAAQAAWQMFGNLGTEKDFIENFMKTTGMWKGFFPEVYPGSKTDESDPGFINWSFWLMTELCDYYDRSGDAGFIAECRKRVEDFVDGLLSLRGDSGLIETERGEFVDWSLANRDFALKPVSIPNNCLAVCVLERLSWLYARKDWKEAAEEMRRVIRKLDTDAGIFGGGGDGAAVKDGKLMRTDCPTEGGQALELWSGFHREDKDYIKNFVHMMGPCPEYRANPNIGKANLFIGLMIRFDVLGKLGYIKELVRELKDVYLEELKLGSGTFFENINAFSGCHGFNGMAGALLTEKVLGLGQPAQRTKTVVIEPHPGDLRWAEGSTSCDDGMFFLKWSADADLHTLKIRLTMPEGWKADFRRAFELSGWQIEMNGKPM